IRNYNNALHKSFPNLEQAELHYQEAKNTGVINMLKHDVQADDVYVVLQGVKPGVYICRGLMMSDGLGWWGGVVMALNGTASQACAMFNHWKMQGKVRYLP
ncbi:hypothetical protein BT96DRAFT_782189, partial [Gymnopus androsaceus JB14]